MVLKSSYKEIKMSTRNGLGDGLRLTSVGVAACAFGLVASLFAFCKKHGCETLPYVSRVATCGTREIENLEISLVVALAVLLAASAAQQRALGRLSERQVNATVLLVPVTILCMTFDRERHRKAHLMLFYLMLFLLLCFFCNSWVPLLVYAPIATRIYLTYNDKPDEVEFFNAKLGPPIQAAILVSLVLGLIAFNITGAAAAEALEKSRAPA